MMDDSDWVNDKESPYFGSVEYYRFIKDGTIKEFTHQRVTIVKGDLPIQKLELLSKRFWLVIN